MTHSRSPTLPKCRRREKEKEPQIFIKSYPLLSLETFFLSFMTNPKDPPSPPKQTGVNQENPYTFQMIPYALPTYDR